MGSQRKSVFERLGPLPVNTPSLPPPLPSAEERAAPAKQRVALTHPLIARHLTLARLQHAASFGGGQPGLQPAAQEQPAQQRQQQQRRRQQPHRHQHGSLASSPEDKQQRHWQPQRKGSKDHQDGLHKELQRLAAERDAAEEMLGQMAAQTQSLLADKSALQQQAVKMEALACALQERLDFLLLEDNSQEWDAQEGLLPNAADSEGAGSYGSSAAQPSTPSAAHGLHDAVTPALHGRLDAIAAEQQQQLRVAAETRTSSSNGASSPPSSRSSPGQAAPVADYE